MKLRLLIVLVFIQFSFFMAKAADTLTIIHHKNYYPYAYVNKDKGSDGILIDFWNLWAHENKCSIKFVPCPDSMFVEMLETGKADILAGEIMNDSLAQRIDFSDPILRINTTIFLKKKYKPVSVYDIDFPLYTINNEHTTRFIKDKFPDIQLITIENLTSFLKVISSDSCQGFIYNIPNPLQGKSKITLPGKYYAYHSLLSDKIRLAVKKDNSDLRSRVIEGIAKIPNNQILDLANQYIRFNHRNNLVYTVIAGSLIVILLLGFYIFSLLKQQNQTRKTAFFEWAQDWQILIDKGENDYIEFKSSLRYDYRQEKPNKALEQVIVKTLSAFLNSEGGYLFIGVDDSGKILGLENDYQSLGKKNSDGFILTLTNLINQHLGKKTHKFLHCNIIKMNDKDVCIVNIEKCETPVFIKIGNEEEFYIRAAASSQPLSIREAHEYINSNWKSTLSKRSK